MNGRLRRLPGRHSAVRKSRQIGASSRRSGSVGRPESSAERDSEGSSREAQARAAARRPFDLQRSSSRLTAISAMPAAMPPRTSWLWPYWWAVGSSSSIET